jgi:hypothetical protein
VPKKEIPEHAGSARTQNGIQDEERQNSNPVCVNSDFSFERSIQDHDRLEG